MAVTFKPLLPILILSSLLLYEDWVSTPSCKPVQPPDPTAQNNNPAHDDDDLKVMLVSDLLLLGSDLVSPSYFRFLFRHYYLSKFFEKSMSTLVPDMLVILGDISARGHELSRTQLASMVRQFHGVVGPSFLKLPIHMALGDRDVGSCSELREEAVSWITRAVGVGGLDSAGNGGFEIGNVSFVSLNAVALMCGSNEVRFGVEKAVERERVDFRVGNEEGKMVKRDGPVVLLHFPLHRMLMLIVLIIVLTFLTKGRMLEVEVHTICYRSYRRMLLSTYFKLSGQGLFSVPTPRNLTIISIQMAPVRLPFQP